MLVLFSDFRSSLNMVNFQTNFFAFNFKNKAGNTLHSMVVGMWCPSRIHADAFKSIKQYLRVQNFGEKTDNEHDKQQS